MTPSDSERRAHSRVDLRLPLRYQVVAHAGTLAFDSLSRAIREHVTEDISQGGACFRTSEFLSRDTVILLIFNFPSLSKPVKAVSSVIWCRQADTGDYRVGVRYLAIRPESIEGMLQAASRSSGQAKEPPEQV